MSDDLRLTEEQWHTIRMDSRENAEAVIEAIVRVAEAQAAADALETLAVEFDGHVQKNNAAAWIPVHLRVRAAEFRQQGEG